MKKLKKNDDGFVDLFDEQQATYGDLNVPIAQKLQTMRWKKEDALSEYQDHQLLYSILLMNAYYQEIPLFLDQKRVKYK